MARPGLILDTGYDRFHRFILGPLLVLVPIEWFYLKCAYPSFIDPRIEPFEIAFMGSVPVFMGIFITLHGFTQRVILTCESLHVYPGLLRPDIVKLKHIREIEVSQDGQCYRITTRPLPRYFQTNKKYYRFPEYFQINFDTLGDRQSRQDFLKNLTNLTGIRPRETHP